MADLTDALNNKLLTTVRITEDLMLAEEIVFTRNSPLVVQGACGGGTRACTITPARNDPDFSDVWGYTCSDWRGYCGTTSPSYIDDCPVPSMPEEGPDGSTCEEGGYVDASGYYYSKAHMDDVRSQCSRACAVVLDSELLDSGSSDTDTVTDYDPAADSDEAVDEAFQIRLFGITLNLKQPDQELSFVGLTFDGGMPPDGVGPVGTSGAIQRIQFCCEANQETC